MSQLEPLKNPYITHATVDRLTFDEYGEAALMNLFRKLKADKETSLIRLHGGEVGVMRKFHYKSALVPTDDDDGSRTGDRFYSLEQFAVLIFRFNRLSQHKINQIRSATTKAQQVLDSLKEVLQ